MAKPTSGKFNRRPIEGFAIQFDGTISALLGIFEKLTGDTDNVLVSINFGSNSMVRQVSFIGPEVNITLNNRDWVIVPEDGSSMFVVTNDEYLSYWESSEPAPEPTPEPAQAKRKKS